MPTSPFGHIECFVKFLVMADPSSLLDVGLGNGKLGFIARDVLDVMLGQRYRREHWKIRIDGIEIFADYIQGHQRAIYDNIYLGDAFVLIDMLGAYDVIVLGDVLEHFEKAKAFAFLDKCGRHTNKYLILGVPLTDGWKQPAIYGNPYEEHRSAWSYEEFKALACAHEIFNYGPGPYGAFLIKKKDYVKHRAAQLGSISAKSVCSIPKSLREKYSLTKKNISEISLSRFSPYVANQIHRNYFFDTNFQEHYQLIAYLSTQFQNSILIDVGTNLGYSALALSFNETNRVISYDVVECKQLSFSEKLDRIEYRIGDVLKDLRIFDAPLIMLDTNHDGIFEQRFYHHLRENEYRGLLFLDDIHLNRAMRNFWHSIAETKEDITDLGHWSGSGLVDFG